MKCGANDVKIFAFLNKAVCRKEEAKDLKVDMVGYEIPNFWIVGYGIDYNQ